MLMGGDINVNSMRRYNDSLVGILKQTILEHEAIFRRQVHELHRLYKIQKTLMEDLSWKEFKGCTSWTTSAQSIPTSLEDRPKYRQLNGEKFLPALSMVGLTQTTNQDCLGRILGTCSMLKPRSFDLQLPADDYISNFGAEFPKQSKQGNSWASPKEAMKVGKFSVDDQIADLEEVKLSLSAGKETRNQGKESTHPSLPIPDVIDLEIPVGRTSLGGAMPFSSIDCEAPPAHSGDNSGLRGSVPCVLGGKAREDTGHWIYMKCSLKDNERQEQKSFVTGINDCLGGNPSANQCNRKPSSSWNMELVDLNRVQLEEPSCFSNAPLVTLSSPAASSSGVHRFSDESLKETNTVSTCWRKPNSSSSDETSDLLHLDNAANSTLTDAGEKDNGTQASSGSAKLKANNGSKIGLIDLESLPEDPLELSEELDNQNTDPRENNVDLSIGRHCGLLLQDDKMNDSIVSPSFKLVDSHLYTSVGCTHLAQTANDKEIGQESYEKSEEDTVSSSPCQSHVIQGECYLGSPATEKPNWVDSSKRVKMQLGQDYNHELVGSDCSVLEESRTNFINSQGTETHSSVHDPIVEAADCACEKGNSCKCSKSNSQDCDDLQETDHLVSRAAESLLHISLESSICPQECIPNEGPVGPSNEQEEEPQYSSDSFESIVLRMDDSGMDDYCVTSAPVEVKGGCGVSLRRGRRLKDFQKDVLPGLVSLSRHEICEDIHSIGGIIKSNEFRKGRSKKVSAQNWFEPMRSRRSRFSYVC